MKPDVRWKQRFTNFDRGVALLDEALKKDVAALSMLEKEGVIQRFEYTFELAWKTLKDFLEGSGLVISPVTPRQVLKDAFAAKILPDGREKHPPAGGIHEAAKEVSSFVCFCGQVPVEGFQRGQVAAGYGRDRRLKHKGIISVGKEIAVAEKRRGFLFDTVALLPSSALLVEKEHGLLTLDLVVNSQVG